MGFEIPGMVSPQQAALRQTEKQLQVESILGTVYTESSKIAEEAANGPQIMPGTGGKTPGMLMQEQQAKLEAQNRVQKVVVATDWDNLSVSLGQDIAALAHQQRALSDKIVKDSSVSFFDDPLTAVMNAFTLPWSEQALDGVNAKLDSTTKSMNAAHSHVQQSAITADKIRSDVTQATLAEQATALEKWQRAVASQARIDSLKTGAEAIKQSMSMDKEALNIYVQERSLRNSDEHMAMARRSEERQVQVFNKQLKEITDKEEADKVRLGFVNSALRESGLNELDIKKFNVYKQSSGTYLDELTQMGLRLAATPDKKDFTLGGTIESRFKAINTLGWQPKTPQQLAIVQMQQDARKAEEATTKDPKLIAINSDVKFNKDFRAAQTNIKEGSPFAAPALGVYAGTRVSENPIWKQYIAPTINDANKNTPMTPDFVRKVLSKAVVDRSVTSSQAAEFAKSVFDQAIVLNNEVHKFKNIAGQDQTTYGVKMDMGVPLSDVVKQGLLFVASGGRAAPQFGGMLNNIKDFTATDKTQWENLIARDVALKIIKADITNKIQ